MLEDILRNSAQELELQFDAHDSDAFMHRLAVRITQDASLPPRVQNGGPAAVAKEALAPARRTGASRARSRRGARRRPTPLCPPDPAAAPEAVLEHVRGLCRQVVSSAHIDSLADFADDYDEAGARTFACLLYVLDRREGALFWWRFAAGAGDPLAAHLLEAHHAAVGTVPEARVWRAFSRLLGFAERHLPRLERSAPSYDDSGARELLGGNDTVLRAFMKTDDVALAVSR
ncbi:MULTISPECIES: hypothetical protein [unclassified Streptomyces]|uniref:hypothetical protein n=1 Tax=unclassified Streptomyces TaxID=2593676 RepID=UPI002285ECB7|nr:hypothetical protein [Streptomyces sp. Je 1-369]WAL93741.1 hypothetical protein NOO62_04075 [Streptomyces sp. Je 1-369]